MDTLLPRLSHILHHFCSIIILRFTVESFVIVLRALIEFKSFAFFYSATLFHFDKRDT